MLERERTWNSDKNKNEKIGVSVSTTCCVHVKSFLQADTRSVKRAMQSGCWCGGVDFRLGDLHGTRISDYMSRIIESRGEAMPV